MVSNSQDVGFHLFVSASDLRFGDWNTFLKLCTRKCRYTRIQRFVSARLMGESNAFDFLNKILAEFVS